jgi:ADP-ribosylglycohydrolase
MLGLNDRYRGLLLGTAVGDSIGLPAEGISRLRAKKMFPGPWRHRFILGRGMLSDDTEHTLFVVQSLLAHSTSAERFARRLGWCLKWWFASLPAGIGMATARACLKLWFGFTAQNSGVFSAGNGPAMRSAPIGAFFCASAGELGAFTEASARVTHTDPKALIGSRAIAVAAALIVRDGPERRPAPEAFCKLLREVAPEDAEWSGIVGMIESGLTGDLTVDDFVRSIGQEEGVTGYVYHTVPVVLFAWHRHFGDYAQTLTSVWTCGGDTDTTGAIAGALAGLTTGEDGIPEDWVRGINDWPRTVPLLRIAADRLAQLRNTAVSPGPVAYFRPGIVPRNIVFLLVVLVHGFRRLFPPY